MQGTSKSSKDWSSMTTVEKTIGIIGVILVVAVVVWAASALFSGNDDTTISQNDAERYCQDVSLLGKHIGSDVSIVTIDGYNPHYTDTGEKADDGTPIMSLQWDGRDKEADTIVAFGCDVSGTKDGITLHSLRVNGDIVEGN